MKTMEKEGKREIWTILGMFGKFGQVWTRKKIRKMGEKAERIRKGNKNLSGCGGGEEEGESRI